MVRLTSAASRLKVATMVGGISVLAIAPATPAKVQDNCRRIAVEGSAGPVTELATWYVYDNTTPTAGTLSQSCPVKPLSDETNLEYMRRLAWRWGDGAALDCPSEEDLLNPQEETNKCVTLGSSKSCKIKHKIAPKTDGAKKRYVEFCCYDDDVCKDKLSVTDPDPDPIPITVVVDRDGLPTPCPPLNCVDNCEDCTVDVDPIAMRHLPTGPGAACRDAIAKAVNAYTTGTTTALTECHNMLAAEAIPPTTDCNSPDDDFATVLAIESLASIINDATEKCADTTRTPAEMGYGTCKAPCASIAVIDWPEVAECLRCQAQEASIDTVETIYGPTTPPGSLTFGAPRSVTPDGQACQAAVGKAVTSVAAVRASETAKCQKKVDAGTALPPGVASCKANDPKGLIQKAEEDIDSAVASDCTQSALNELALCNTADATALTECANEAAVVLSDSVSSDAIPNGAKCLLCRPLVATGKINCIGGSQYIPCTGTDQDGELRKGAARSYTDNGDGTITDNVTGLTWEQLRDDGSIHDKDTSYQWAQASSSKVATLNATSFAGYSDWRLPDVHELQTLANYGELPAIGITGCVSGCTALPSLWTSTSDAAPGQTSAWIVGSQRGDVRLQPKTNLASVRAVRGDAFAAQSFTDNGDGTITDNGTGLMWEKLSYDGSVHDNNFPDVWDAAFGKVGFLNNTGFAGHSDWRVPNVNELKSLIDYSRSGPALHQAFNTNCMPGCTVTTCSCTGSSYYWTSTGDTSSGPAYAWVVGAPTGDLKSQLITMLTSQALIRAVRGGH